MRLLIPLCLSAALLAGCQRPAPPNPEKPPEPQALAKAINQPLDRAKGVQQTVDEGAERERQAEADATR
ncbi:hypothetical protein C1922_14010 [Stenotrophomonas sp. ZAC14D2_NAIMI4_7]|uniref:hypothetical protein n=1 Tax=Stenotrophomonas TaxID=40323 RepID=UPI000D53C5D7|nr:MULTISPECIES: hypothetical protein [Stenotrophomonas]AWH18331.1 hypothetical protein C1922_14010 [Stenotrophomonas sp. ZAC14D2_NAIMI4_7]AWH22905.1 hypothetical protein C1933_17585 [Stenotrophomonas sp. ZAC14D2_NAIMI4_6]AWH30651.1 hypothetical protein C1931_17865 [Stenotrophomonas sp. YAU14A_MKIMI4_1]AWH34597.1 hypothetical protein C1930_17790 [Stenotrophomonas sp. SAU14A_NAIMI4_8]MBK0026428.1 hypothetical protein [Stenotrophomonas sp. S48]